MPSFHNSAFLETNSWKKWPHHCADTYLQFLRPLWISDCDDAGGMEIKMCSAYIFMFVCVFKGVVDWWNTVCYDVSLNVWWGWLVVVLVHNRSQMQQINQLSFLGLLCCRASSGGVFARWFKKSTGFTSQTSTLKKLRIQLPPPSSSWKCQVESLHNRIGQSRQNKKKSRSA